MGALRRPQPLVQPRVENRASGHVPEQRQKPVPRWMVVTGLLAYCAVFWVLIWTVGSLGLDWVHTATAGAP